MRSSASRVMRRPFPPQGRGVLAIGTGRVSDVKGRRHLPASVVMKKKSEVLSVVVFVSEEIGKYRPSEKLLHFSLRLREPISEAHEVKIVEDGFPEVGVEEPCGRHVVNASRGRTVEPFHPEPVGGLGAASALRAFKSFHAGVRMPAFSATEKAAASKRPSSWARGKSGAVNLTSLAVISSFGTSEARVKSSPNQRCAFGRDPPALPQATSSGKSSVSSVSRKCWAAVPSAVRGTLSFAGGVDPAGS